MSELPAEQPEMPEENEAPPILGSWRNLNIVVLSWLALLIAVMYGFTRYFS